jgi:hypothetical protein
MMPLIGAVEYAAVLTLPLLCFDASAQTKTAAQARAQSLSVRQQDPCARIEHADHPSVTLSNGRLTAVIFLPDAKNGYYRSTRFDWSGLIPCVSLNGHRFFGEWFLGAYDPMRNDAVAGPAEEFRIDNGTLGHYQPSPGRLTIDTHAIGYDDAKPGGAFLKPGVGILQKIDDQPYSYHTVYPILGGGTWTTKVSRTSIAFRQVLIGRDGWGYVYEKTLTLDTNDTGITLAHSLRNTGQKTIDTKVYDHDFITFDGQPASPDIVVKLPFTPRPAEPLDATLQVVGDELHFLRAMRPGETEAVYFTGYSEKVADYDITVENTRTKVGVEQASDTPIDRTYFWTNGVAVCPEFYIHKSIGPGKLANWKLHYRFFAPAA